ncbi:MAG: hypothetical protein M3M95_06680, partial [Pseudomonadota bacterium]|nr:hypothetical protein [Pseudomonadota bacterium]
MADGADVLGLDAPAGAPIAWRIEIAGPDPASRRRGFRLTGEAEGRPAILEQALPDTGQNSYLDLFAAVARVFGTRLPLGRRPPTHGAPRAPLTPLLTEPISPDILYGYGDPSVLRVEGEGPDAGWWMVVTSNDAPNAFPILRSDDLKTWRPAGFVFPEGRTPAWALTGENQADFWAPEMHQ